ncbi:MAG: hypothetical protein WDN45_06000 [Caulobacteraceae bacterium]
MIRATCLALVLLAAGAQGALAADILIHDDKSSPESMAVGADGTVYAAAPPRPTSTG